ncbi:MAG: hypothetical protein CMF61_03395 [Magnetococcales bacterium]|nr:hypothetical protein [Magnetococcales bacterium]
MTNATTNNTATEATATEAKPVFRAGTSRAVALDLFTAKLPQRAELGNTEFRKAVIADMMEQQNMTLASAAATYNIIKKYAVANEIVDDFGRTPAEPKPAKTAKKASKQEAKQEEAKVNVARKKDGEVVAEGVTEAEANALIEKARKGKKAALQIVA